MPVVAKGVLIAYGMTLLAFGVYSAALTYTDLPEHYMQVIILAVTLGSIAISSGYAAKKLKKNSSISGASIGLIYMLMLHFAGSLISGEFRLSLYSIASMFIGAVVGFLTNMLYLR